MKLKYSEYGFSHTILHYKLYRDPDKVNVIADSIITTTPIIAYIFTGYCLFSLFYRFLPMTENMYIEGAHLSKSHNIALIYSYNLCYFILIGFYEGNS